MISWYKIRLIFSKEPVVVKVARIKRMNAFKQIGKPSMGNNSSVTFCCACGVTLIFIK